MARNQIRGLFLLVLIILLSSSGLCSARSITAPSDVTDLSVMRTDTSSTSPTTTLKYTTDNSGDEVIISTTSVTGTAVKNAVLNIQGGSLTSWTDVTTNPTLVSSTDITGDGTQQTVSGLEFQLDAGSVLSGASGLGAPWTYKITYTIQAS